MTTLTPADELQFQRWYSQIARGYGLNPNPDDPRHFYDYRAAYKAGVDGPDLQTQHWPSEFKLEGHPRTFINGMNTKTGAQATDHDYLTQMGPMRPGLADIYNVER